MIASFCFIDASILLDEYKENYYWYYTIKGKCLLFYHHRNSNSVLSENLFIRLISFSRLSPLAKRTNHHVHNSLENFAFNLLRSTDYTMFLSRCGPRSRVEL